MRTKILLFCICLCTLVITTIIVFILTLEFACYFSPPYYEDIITGVKHLLMPIGQTIFASLISLIYAILFLIFLYKYLKKRGGILILSKR
jgi:hypothetical protein